MIANPTLLKTDSQKTFPFQSWIIPSQNSKKRFLEKTLMQIHILKEGSNSNPLIATLYL